MECGMALETADEGGEVLQGQCFTVQGDSRTLEVEVDGSNGNLRLNRFLQVAQEPSPGEPLFLDELVRERDDGVYNADGQGR